jgi:hypothetical protein
MPTLFSHCDNVFWESGVMSLGVSGGEGEEQGLLEGERWI